MAAKNKFTADDVIRAIIAARGIKSTAADNLGCSRQTIDNYIARNPEIGAVYVAERDRLLDQAESQLVVKVDAGDWPAIRFTLATLGKGRGFTERTETMAFTAPDDGAYQAALDKVYGPKDDAPDV